mmetsp:Transcript_45798/g.85079  ORF Transcript_45798/g.85079 Transcript_45798/m.85079 type:complete len:225 (+) Transcript_45798:660-1334(+)
MLRSKPDSCTPLAVTLIQRLNRIFGPFFPPFSACDSQNRHGQDLHPLRHSPLPRPGSHPEPRTRQGRRLLVVGRTHLRDDRGSHSLLRSRHRADRTVQEDRAGQVHLPPEAHDYAGSGSGQEGFGRTAVESTGKPGGRRQGHSEAGVVRRLRLRRTDEEGDQGAVGAQAQGSVGRFELRQLGPPGHAPGQEAEAIVGEGAEDVQGFLVDAHACWAFEGDLCLSG